MEKIVGYIFNRVYQMFLFFASEKERKRVALTAYLFCSLITGFFIIDLLWIITKSTKVFFLGDGVIYLVVFLITFLFYWFLMLYKKRYLIFLNAFQFEGRLSKWIGNIVIISFSVFSIAYILIIATSIEP